MSAPEAPTLSSQVSRRGFIKVGAAASGGLMVGLHSLGADAAGPGFAPNAFIRIDHQGLVTLIMPNQEMGQGVYTAHSQLIAEELDIGLERVRLEAAPANDELYGGPRKRQSTGGSSSIRAGFFPALRQAGANARALLVAAAAQSWGVPAESLRTENGRVIDDAHGRSADYGELADRASRIPPLPIMAPLKDPSQFKLIGKSVHRLDTPLKVNGSAQYGIDVMAGKIQVATVLQAPVAGGKVRSVDDGQARAVPGVRQIVVLDDLVAVVGDHSWAAIKGMKALNVVWDDGPNAAIDSAHIWDELRRESAKPGVNAAKVGDADKALGEHKRYDRAYEMPLLSHSPMEPLNMTVHLTPGKCELWGGTQVQTRAQADAAKEAGLQPEQVVVNNFMLGGGFGRRLDTDMVVHAVRIAKHVDGPVKVMWTREEDMRHDMYRPVYRNLMSATLKDGHIHGWSHKVASGSIVARMSGKPLKDNIDKGNVDGAVELPYDVAHSRVDYVRVEPKAVQIGYWRGVGPNNCIFAVESFVDELAKEAHIDPIEFRLRMLRKDRRAANLLRHVAHKANWGSPLGHRVGRGVCLQTVFGSWFATVCEAEVDGQGDVHVHRYVCAVDCGMAVNPNGIEAQVQGGIIFGLSAALHGDIQVERGRVVQSNFHDYRLVRINEAPPVEVHLVKSMEKPGGIGEPGVTASTPSLANAIADATGIRLRRMPIDRDILAGRKRA